MAKSTDLDVGGFAPPKVQVFLKQDGAPTKHAGGYVCLYLVLDTRLLPEWHKPPQSKFRLLAVAGYSGSESAAQMWHAFHEWHDYLAEVAAGESVELADGTRMRHMLKIDFGETGDMPNEWKANGSSEDDFGNKQKSGGAFVFPNGPALDTSSPSRRKLAPNPPSAHRRLAFKIISFSYSRILSVPVHSAPDGADATAVQCSRLSDGTKLWKMEGG